MATEPAADPTGPGSMMIGPTRAGKTSLLSALELASRAARYAELGRFAVAAANAQARGLFRMARDIGRIGRTDLAPTLEPERYEIDLRHAPPRSPWKFWQGDAEHTYRFNVIDGRGGDMFTDPSAAAGGKPSGERAQRRAQLVAEAAKTAGLIVCVDSTDTKTTGDFFAELNAFLQDVASACNGPVPFRRVALVLTKADGLVAEEGPGAEAALRRLDPREYAGYLVGRYALSDLFSHLTREARRAVCCGWASVYGFIPNDGAVNFLHTADGGRIAVFDKNDATWTNHWEPFQVLDPFVYVATGQPVGLVQLPDPNTR